MTKTIICKVKKKKKPNKKISILITKTISLKHRVHMGIPWWSSG